MTCTLKIRQVGLLLLAQKRGSGRKRIGFCWWISVVEDAAATLEPGGSLYPVSYGTWSLIL